MRSIKTAFCVGRRCFTSQVRSDAERFRYMTAIVRDLSPRFDEQVTRTIPDKIDKEKATLQKKQYDHFLKNVLGLQVITLPKSEDHPDGVFVEDIVVVIGDDALVTQPSQGRRQREVCEMNNALISIGITPTVMQMIDQEAIMHGSDVMFTGQEIFVGLSDRTNKHGIKVLSDKFSQYPVTTIDIRGQSFLKSVMSFAGPGKIIYNSSTKNGKSVAEQVAARGHYKYSTIPVHGKTTEANCLYLDAPNTGKTVVYHPTLENRKALSALSVANMQPMEISEICKAQGALTSCSVLLCV